MPLVPQSFSQIIDFTRTSAATFVNSSGNIASTPQSRNLLTFTQEFANAAWTKTRCTIIPNVNPAAASLGSELVTNGDFASGTTGWSAANSATLSNSSNRLSVVNGATALGQARSTITTVPGRIYRVAATFTSVAGSRGSVFVGTFAGDNSLFSDSPITASRSVTGYFVATGTTTHIAVGVADNTLALEVLFDDISVRELSGGALQAPDGTFTADKVIANTETNYHAVRIAANPGVVSPQTFSVYAKAAEYTRVHLGNLSSATWGAAFDLSNGTVIATYDNGLFPTITSVGNGWYRCSVTFNGAASGWSYGVIGYPLGATLGSLGAQYTGDGVSGIFVWGAQLEQVPDSNLTLGSELLSAGAIQLIGTATAATYNTSTGVGSATRVDGANQSSVGWTGLNNSASYRIDIENTGANPISMRSGTATGSIPVTVLAGQRVTIYIPPTGGAITITSGFGTANFTVYSFREITAITGIPSTYTRNFGGLFPPRFDYDPVSLAPRGLLIEEQRTNLLTYSQQFDNAAWSRLVSGVGVTAVVTANAGVSPDGTTNAYRVQFDCTDTSSVSNRSYIIQALTVANGTAHRGSLYVKAFDAGNVGKTIRITSDNIGSTIVTLTANWTRVEFGGTSASTSTNFIIECRGTFTTQTADVLIYGAQLEAGAFATSYIPTVASQVTRSADVAAINAPNFASWYNQTAGTFVFEGDSSSLTDYPYAVLANDGTFANRLGIYRSLSSVAGLVVSSSVVQMDISASSVVANVPFKAAVAVQANNGNFSLNGSIGTTDTAITMPSVSRLSLASAPAGTSDFLNGHIRSIRYYPVRLTNAQLQALTA